MNEMRKPERAELMTLAVFAALLLISSQALWAGPVNGLTTFISGQPATAASVNENFSAVSTAVDDNDARINTNTTAIGDNFSLITGNTSDISNLDQRFAPFEAGYTGQDIAIDCVADATALLNTTLVPGNTYVLSGMCDGPIAVREPSGAYRFRGATGKATDGIISPSGLTQYFVFSAFGPVKAILENLTISGANYTSQTDGVYVRTVSSEGGSAVELYNMDIVGGDAGVNAVTAFIYIGDSVSVTDFGQSGLAAGRGGSIVGSSSPITVSGALGLDGGPDGYREAVVGYRNGSIEISGGGSFSGGTDDGTNPDFYSYAVVAADNGSVRIRNNGTVTMDGIVGAYRNGTIRIDTGTITGIIEVGESSVLNLRNVTHSGGNIDAYRNGVLRTDNSILSNASNDLISIGAFSTFRMNGGSIGNASGTEIIDLYTYGVLQTRTGADLGNRNINCAAGSDGKFSRGDAVNIGVGGDCP